MGALVQSFFCGGLLVSRKRMRAVFVGLVDKGASSWLSATLSTFARCRRQSSSARPNPHTTLAISTYSQATGALLSTRLTSEHRVAGRTSVSPTNLQKPFLSETPKCLRTTCMALNNLRDHATRIAIGKPAPRLLPSQAAWVIHGTFRQLPLQLLFSRIDPRINPPYLPRPRKLRAADPCRHHPQGRFPCARQNFKSRAPAG